MPVAPPLLLPAPELPPALVPSDPLELLRVVPLADVLALDEVEVELLALARTLLEALAVEVPESAELALTAELPTPVLDTLLEERDELAVAGLDTPDVAEGEKRALPDEVAAPDPAPEDEPAVLVVVSPEVLLVEDDCTYRSFNVLGLR